MARTTHVTTELKDIAVGHIDAMSRQCETEMIPFIIGIAADPAMIGIEAECADAGCKALLGGALHFRGRPRG